MSREGRAPRLVEPEEMVPTLLYVVSREADNVNGWRFDANLWDAALTPAEAARRAGASPASKFTRTGLMVRTALHSSGYLARSRPAYTVFSRSAV